MAKRPLINSTTAIPEAPLSGLANLMGMKGRDDDSMLVHLSPSEVNNLNKLSGNTMTINPDTGLPEGRSRFLDAILPAIASIAVGVATGGASIPAQIAAQAATGYGSARLTGKDHDEALTSGLVSGATAGLLGGTGTAGLDKAVTAGGSTGAYAGTKAAGVLSEKGLANLGKGWAEKGIGELASSAFVPSNLLNDVTKQAIQDQGLKALANPALAVPHLTQAAMKTGANAAVDQMRADANYVPPTPEVAEEIDIYSTPFTQTSLGPFNQQQIASNFISGGTGPYGMNYFNQAYGQEGGQVSEMNQGGLTQFNSIMGNPALQLQNPNPPLTYGFGGALGRALGIGGGSSASSQGGPRGSSQGGKGSGFFKEMMENPEVIAMLQKGQEQPEQKMALGGDLGKYIPSVAIINSLMGKLGSDKKNVSPTTTNNYYGTGPDGQPILMDGPPKQIHMGNPMPMAGGGQLDS